jgi:hypothetical protein
VTTGVDLSRVFQKNLFKSEIEVIVMACNRCASENHREFNGELAIHFPGIAGLEKPIVWTYPKLFVCLDCGQAKFDVPERELRVLVTGVPVRGAIVLPPREETAS